jgi:hypothetical protein
MVVVVMVVGLGEGSCSPINITPTNPMHTATSPNVTVLSVAVSSSVAARSLLRFPIFQLAWW